MSTSYNFIYEEQKQGYGIFKVKDVPAEVLKPDGVSGMIEKGKMDQIVSLLEEMAADRRVPRNVRAAVADAIDLLKEEKESDLVKLNTVISIMDELSNDPNILPYTRTQIWNIVSVLEAVQASEREKEK